LPGEVIDCSIPASGWGETFAGDLREPAMVKAAVEHGFDGEQAILIWLSRRTD
jgi:hypothetical protein